MKTTIALLAFLLNSIVITNLHAQIPKAAVSLEDSKYNSVFSNSYTIPIIEGKISNITKSELDSLQIQYTLPTPFSAKQVSKLTKLDSSGSFKIILDYPFPYQQILLGIGDIFFTSLTINKGLIIDIDWKLIKEAKNFQLNGKGLQFSGLDGALNNYFNNYILYHRAEQSKYSIALSTILEKKQTTQSDFMQSYNLIFDSIKIIQENYIQENPSNFGWILEDERMSQYYGKLCIRYWGKLMDTTLWQLIQNHKSYLTTNNSTSFYYYLATYIATLPIKKVAVSWKDLVGTYDLNKDELVAIDSLKNHEEYVKTGQSSYSSDSVTKKRILTWSNVLKNKLSKQLLLKRNDNSIYLLDSLFAPAKADFMKMQLYTSNDLLEQKLVIEKIIASMHTQWTKTVFLNEYRLKAEKVASINKTLEGSANSSFKSGIGKLILQTNFGAKLYEVKNVSAIDFLTSLKNRYRDTAIVLDIWATWCVPCLAEMPHSKKLLQETKDQPVVFVYLCTSNTSDIQKWEYKIAEIKQPGIHYFIDETLDTELHNIFSLSGYPGYAFINRKGVYQPGAFRRVSELDRSKLVELINQK
jgi:thiol-disulfide isomerase/thioredoxin